jgi:dTDP-4-dehydrorhamnose reductase
VKVAVIGANGQLGSSLVKSLARRRIECVPLTRHEVDVTAVETVRQALRHHRPQVVVNTAAYHRVDLCEGTPADTFLVNASGARNVAVAAREVSAVPVFISTDYVFDGAKRKPYDESDRPNPQSVYATSKLAGEYMTLIGGNRGFVVRSTGLYAIGGSAGKGGNFVETMVRLAEGGKTLKVVADQVLAPTYAVDLAESLCDLIQTQDHGVYHLTNAGECSWHDFAAKIFALAGIRADLHPTTTQEYAARAARPAYSVLDNRRARDAGLAPMRPWDAALAAYLEERSAAR